MDQKTILIIEDEPTINRIISNYFVKEDYKVLSALNGEKGLELFHNNHVDVICLDIMIPKVSGWQVAKTVRETSNVPIVLMSALSEEEDILKGYSLNVDDYITKPFAPSVLMAKIKSLLTRIEYSETTNLSGTYEVNGIKIDLDSFNEDSPLKELLTHDELTGIPNRRYLDFYLQNMKKRADDFHDTFGVIFIDIDFFKNINDTYGHQIGDEILKLIAKTLQTNVRNNDLVGRYGGEEFIGVIQIDNQKQLRIISEKLRLLIEQSSYDYEGKEIKVTISIGGTIYQDRESIESLVTRADGLMYTSKQNGRNKSTIK